MMSWLVVLLWVGVLTYFIDLLGVMMGWWTNETFFGQPRGRR